MTWKTFFLLIGLGSMLLFAQSLMFDHIEAIAPFFMWLQAHNYIWVAITAASILILALLP